MMREAEDEAVLMAFAESAREIIPQNAALSDGRPRPRDAPRDAALSVLQEPRSVPLEGGDWPAAPEGPRVNSSDA